MMNTNEQKYKELTTDECMEIFKKYDPEFYKHYYHNMWYFGYNARNYALYLKKKHESLPKSAYTSANGKTGKVYYDDWNGVAAYPDTYNRDFNKES